MLKFYNIFRINSNTTASTIIGKLPMGFIGLEFIADNMEGRFQAKCITPGMEFTLYIDNTYPIEFVNPTEVDQHVLYGEIPYRVVGFSQYGHRTESVSLEKLPTHHVVHIQDDNGKQDIFKITDLKVITY
jgi:hypothetical protein